MPSIVPAKSPSRLPDAVAPWRQAMGLLLAAALLAIGLGATSPEVHDHVHHDADHPGHACAITLAATGFCDTAAAPPAALVTRTTVARVVPDLVSYAWTTPEYWLIPTQAPPVAGA